MTEKERYNISKKVSIISLAVNILLAVIKITIGFLFASKALIADGLHSVSDMASTVIVFLSIRFASIPADEDHPYGHGKAEALGTALLGFILVFTGLALIKDTGLNIINGDLAVPGVLTLWAALLSIISKELLYQYTVRRGKKIKSKGLIADAHHHRSDALSSIAALIGIAGARLGYPVLDPLAGLIVALLIVKIGLDILKDAVNDLMDHTLEEEKINSLRDTAYHVEGVKNVSEIKTRSYGPKFIVDLEIAVDKDISVLEGHEVAAAVRAKLQDRDPRIKEVMVHVDPWIKNEKN